MNDGNQGIHLYVYVCVLVLLKASEEQSLVLVLVSQLKDKRVTKTLIVLVNHN